jgi:peptide/nickel transport system permease protein
LAVESVAVIRLASGKLLRLLLLLVAVASLSYAILSLSPIDPVRAYVGDDALRISPEQRQKIAERWGLDKPAWERYTLWLGHIARGDLGRSQIYNRPVLDVIVEKARLSAGLMAVAWSLSGIIGFVLGVLAGASHGSWLDKLLRWFAYLVASAPAFWVGMILLVVFSVTLQVAPSCCAAPPGVDPSQVTLGLWLRHLALPALTLSLTGVAGVLLHTRQKLLDVLKSDYALLARAQGASLPAIIWHHGLRNIAVPAINVHFASFSELFGGAVLAEQVFAYPGLGQATVQAGLRSDVPLLLGIVLASAVFVFTGNAIADLLSRVVDPRIRVGAGT